MPDSLSPAKSHGFNPVDTVFRNLNEQRPMLNNYTRYARIGNGHHGEVFLCFRIDARFPVNDVRRWFPVAMKSVRRDTIIDKYSRLKANRIALAAPRPPEPAVVDKLNTTELKIKKEIAIMKKLSHPNVVRLFEVIDDRMKEKVYLVMEYLGGGEIKWRTGKDEPTLTLAQTRRIMRDAILGLEYLHYQGIIHRDIKPANLLWTEDRHHVKIADFGVSHFSYHQRLAEAGEEGVNQDDLDDILMDESDLTKRAGTPAFLAPELIFEHFEEKNKHFVVSSLVPRFSNKHTPKPTITKAIDVWALGVTLYCLLFGKTPFLSVTEGGATEFALYRAICNKDWEVVPVMCRDQVPTGGRHPKKGGKLKQPEGAKVIGLLERFLQKDQTKRITLDEVKRYRWIMAGLLHPSEWAKLTSPDRKAKVEVTKSDMFLAVSSVHFRWGLRRGMSALFKPLKARSRMTPATDYSAMGTSNKSDPYLGRLPPNGGSNKSPATSRVQDVHVYTQSRTLGEEKVDKGKGKAVFRNSSQPSSLGGLSATSSSPALDAIRRQRSQMGILGHEQQQFEKQLSNSPSGSTPVDPAPKLEDIMSIATWRPTKYPTPTTSLTPLLANINADGTSTFRSFRSPRSRKPDPNISVVAPAPGVPPRTVSTLEGGLWPAEDMVGIYGPEGGLVPDAPAAALTNFKRASSWGQGDEMAIAIGAATDIVSVTSANAELDDTVKLVGAGGVERLGGPVSPITPVSAGDNVGPGRVRSDGRSGSVGEGTADGRRSVCAKSSVSERSCGSGVVMQWERPGEGIVKWRDHRKNHHRDASSSTLPWVDSLDDIVLGISGLNSAAQTGSKEKSGDQEHSQTESRGELTMEWMDDNYRTPGGYYGASMGPATQFWRHGRGVWSESSTMTKSATSSGDRDSALDHDGTSAVRYQKEVKVVRRRQGPLDKFLSGGDSDSDEGSSDEGDESSYGSSGAKRFGDDDQEQPGEQPGEHCGEDNVNESETDDEDEHVQQITIKFKGKNSVH